MSTETKKALLEARRANLHRQYLRGIGLAIGPKGYENSVDPEIPFAIHIDLDYPNYNGKTLPFANDSQDFVYSSHVLEHIKDSYDALSEWFRVLKPGGYLFIVVPHAYLYERLREVHHATSSQLPKSMWNEDHYRVYTPGSLLRAVDVALVSNTWRLRHCADNDYGYDYTIPKDKHPGGGYEIECIIEKLKTPPTWEVT